MTSHESADEVPRAAEPAVMASGIARTQAAQTDGAVPPLSTAERDLMYELIAVGVKAVSQGLVLGSGGNLSARVPGSSRFVVTASSTWLDRLDADDFSVIDMSGGVLLGAPTPSSEWKLHQRTYAVRDDVNAIVHVHPQYAVLVDAIGAPIRLITLDHVAYVRSVGRVGYFPNGSDELADGAAKQALEHNTMVLAHHGCSAIGEDVDMAFRRATNLEEAATATYRLLVLGDTGTAFPAEHLTAIHQ
jgi:L-fuculose-phosphate aldolase